MFHTLRTKLRVKYLEKHFMLKYHSCIQKIIKEEMEFLNISSLGTTYWYVAKIEKKFKQKKRYFGSMNQKQVKGAPKPQNKAKRKGKVTQHNLPKP